MNVAILLPSLSDKASLLLSLSDANVAILLPSLSDKASLLLSLSDVNIPSLPREVLERMWYKAEQLRIVPQAKLWEGPCSSSSTKCYVVASK